MADIKAKFSSKANITITVASVTNNSVNQSDYIDNSTNLYLDCLVQGFIKAGASSTSATGVVNLYAYGSVDGGTTYTDGATGTAGSHTLNKNAALLGVITLDANAETAKFGPFSVANALGYVPPRWGIIMENKSGGTLDTTGGNHEIHYIGVHLQSV